MKKHILSWIVSIGIVILIIASIFGMFNDRRAADAQRWNGGVCSECGGQLKFKETVSTWVKVRVDKYLFECDKCGAIVELYELEGGVSE